MKNLKTHKSLIVNNFTLIELLITIAIIAILAAMLLPTLSRARDTAKWITCTNNMKQLGTSFMMYADTSDAYFPPYFGTGEAWPVPFYANVGVVWPKKLEVSGALTSWSILICPAKRNKYASDFKQNKPGAGITYVDYGYNHMHIGSSIRAAYGGSQVPAKPNQIKKPSATIVATDVYLRSNPRGEIGYYVLQDSYTTANYFGQVDGCHSGSANILWIDGHVSSERTTKNKDGNPYIIDPFRNGTTVGAIDNHFDRE